MVPGETIGREDVRKHLEAYDYEDLMTKDISSLKKAREEFEKDLIIKVLRKNDKNVTVTSKELGIERTTLHRKIKKYNINIDKL